MAENKSHRATLDIASAFSRANVDSGQKYFEYELHPSSVADSKLRAVKTSLLRWVNNVLTPKSIVIRNLNDEMTDGHVMANFLALLTGDSSALENLQAVSSERNKVRNWEYVGSWLSSNLKIEPSKVPNKAWSYNGIVKEDQSSILLLLLEIAKKAGCPFPFPPSVTIAVIHNEKIDDAIKKKTTLYVLTDNVSNSQSSNNNMGLRIENLSDASLNQKRPLYNKGISVKDIYRKKEQVGLSENPADETQDSNSQQQVSIPANAPNVAVSRMTAVPKLVQNTYVEEEGGEDEGADGSLVKLVSSVDDLSIDKGEQQNQKNSGLLLDDTFDKLSLYPEKLQQVTDLVVVFVNKYFEPINLKLSQPLPESEAKRKALPSADPRSQLPVGALELTEDFHDGIFFLLLLGMLGNFFIPLNQYRLEVLANTGEVMDGTLTLADKLENARLMVSLMSELNMDVRKIQPSDIIRKDFKSVLRCLFVMSNHFSQ